MAIALNQIVANSNISFGTSGARGLVTDFTDQVCAAFTQAFIETMRRSFVFERVAIAIDNRPSSTAIASTCAGMAKAMGLGVDYYGVLPTPALAYKAMQDLVPAIMVTGSHIPFDRNGLKFYRPDGEISKEDELAIMSVTSSLSEMTISLPDVNSAGVDSYIKRYTSVFPRNCLSGKHIGIYEHSSAGRDIYKYIFRELGAKVTSLGRTDTFVPIDTEAVAESDKQNALIWASQYKFDAIFSTDGDGDRPLIADENGTWLRGDIVGLLCAKLLKVDALAVPLSCNTAIELSGLFSQVVRTKIGSPYVIAAFAELTRSSTCFAGFEANGGFLLGSDIMLNSAKLRALPTRDALLPGLVLLASGERKLSELTAELPSRFTASDRMQNIAASQSNAFLTAAKIAPELVVKKLNISDGDIRSSNQQDGWRITFSNDDIVHFRPSGNAPELRVYAESNNQKGADDLVQSALSALQIYFLSFEVETNINEQ